MSEQAYKRACMMCVPACERACAIVNVHECVYVHVSVFTYDKHVSVHVGQHVLANVCECTNVCVCVRGWSSFSICVTGF